MRDISRLEYASEAVLSLIEKGEPAYAALEMCGRIPSSTFWLWLSRGRAISDPDNVYHRLWLRYRVAVAQGKKIQREASRKKREDPQLYENNRTNRHNPKYLDSFTQEKQDIIVEKIKAGAFLDDAIMAAGIEVHIGRHWLELGHRLAVDEGTDEYGFFMFHKRVIVAQAETRADVAARLLQDSPALWALHGPGRSVEGREGWEKNTKITATLDKRVSIETNWRTASQPIVEGSSARHLQIDFRPGGGGAGDMEEDEN